MTAPNVYMPYPIPQNLNELKADVEALVNQPGVPLELQDQVLNAENSPEVQADVDEAEANSDSMANE
jgi:hypothetical protein